MSRRLIPAVAGALAIALIGLVGASLPSSAADQPAFSDDFTSNDFAARFDYGYSGLVAPQNAIPVSSLTFHGDHDMNCGSPDTQRTVTIGGTPQQLDYSQLFWHCAPGGDPAKGHLMSGVDTLGYNIAWFSPKGYFTNVSKVCWDVNETNVANRKWVQINFVSPADATRYPIGATIPMGGGTSYARGSGGFDLGYTSPDFRDVNGPTTGLVPQGGTLAGLRDQDGSLSWFDHQDTWQSLFVGPGPPYLGDREQTTDKAARYTHCLEQTGPNTLTLTKATPASGTVTRTLTGQIPQGPVRVVFADDTYDSPKSPNYDPNVVTWHWDNIQVYADSGGSPSTTTTSSPSTTSTTVVSTSSSVPVSTTSASSSSTLLLTTTTAAPTTLPTTTTTTPSSSSSSTTTTSSSSSTTTTLAPIPACPTSFNATERTWCQRVMQHIAALEAK